MYGFYKQTTNKNPRESNWMWYGDLKRYMSVIATSTSDRGEKY